MASTKVLARKLLVYKDGTAIGASKTATLNVEAASIDITTKDDGGWNANLTDMKSWSIDVDALLAFDETPKVAYDALYDAMIANTSLTVKFSTEVAGDDRFYGTGYITSAPIQAAQGDVISYTLSIIGSGTLTRETIT